MKLKSIDPRIKLAVLAVLSGFAVFSKSVLMLSLLLILTVVLLAVGGVPLKAVFGKSRRYIRIIVSLFIIQCVFTRSGEPAISAGSFVLITKAGLSAAGLVSLRLLLILSSAHIILTGEARDYLLALTQMHVPYEIAFMVMVALRFIPMLREEAQDVLAAVQMRGLNIKKAPIRKKISAYASILVPIVAGALRRSEKTAMAMEARCFRAKPERTYIRRLTLQRSDLVYFAVFSASVIALFIIKELILCISF